MEKRRLLIFAIFIIMGIIFATIGFMSYYSSNSLVKDSETTNGIIEDGNLVFTISDGQEISKTSLYIKMQKTGKEVEVLYNLDDPLSAKINSFFSLWFFSVLMFIISLTLILIAVFELIKKK